MRKIDFDDYTETTECEYRGERYSVRNNGAVLRHQPEGKRARPNDNQWTFGKENSSNPYLHVSGVPVHRIVAMAFHGNPDNPKHVVDHIDSNCRNNRPENLRWLSRLENALKNPVTRKKIEYLCGNVEAFLENPSILNDIRSDPNFGWMRTVTPEEAHNCLVRMSVWARTDSSTARSNRTGTGRSSFAERAYKPLQKWEVGLDREPGLELAMTPWCAQYMWWVSFFFPSCPQEFGPDPIDDYLQNLEAGAVLAYSEDDGTCLKFTVLKAAIHSEESSIVVLCEREDQRFAVVGIELHQKSKHFIHFYYGSHASRSDAEAAFQSKLAQQDFWEGAYNTPEDFFGPD